MNVESRKSLNQNTTKLTTNNLKLCPLCDSLNANSNRACFVCGWQGKFVRDPHKLHTSLVLLLEQCPELYPEKKELQKGKHLIPKIVSQFRKTLRKLTKRFHWLRKPFDIRV